MNYIRPCVIKPNIVINVKLNKWAILYFKHFTNMNQKSEEDALAVSVIWSGGKISFDLKAFHIRVHIVFCYVILQHWSSYLLGYTIHCNRDHFSLQIPRIIFRLNLISKWCILPRIVYSNYGCIFSLNFLYSFCNFFRSKIKRNELFPTWCWPHVSVSLLFFFFKIILKFIQIGFFF